MSEWRRVLKPGGNACFISHAPAISLFEYSQRDVLCRYGKRFLPVKPKLFRTRHYWLIRLVFPTNMAWAMAFKQERQFLSYAHEIQIYKHLVEEVSSSMFSTDVQIHAFFEDLGATEISVNVLDKNFTVQPSNDSFSEPVIAWFVALRKPVAQQM